ncbi:MAG: UDP-N-acetylmuramoyl-L-alanine--D-glutamate ligase [Clostridiales bacterium]|nr:UDP-N-acetylmuramoyl-L-alanine--D-glutamate ligase [Clostridiales bacterium]
MRGLNLKNKNILIYGLGVSGKAAFDLIKSQNSNIFLYDNKIDKFKNIKIIKKIDFLISLLNSLDLIIVSPGISLDNVFFKTAKEKKIKIWSEIELAYNMCENNFIAITGTNGKTTTTSVVGKIIKNIDINSQIAGNIGVALSKSILNIKNKKSFIVAEISSFQLESIEKFKPKISAILNITPDHLDRHKTFENYAREKKKVFKNQDKNDFLVINYDDFECRKIYDNHESKSKIVFFSTKKVINDGVYFLDNYIYFKEKKILSCDEINLLGMHNISNICAAIAICFCANIDIKIICNAIKKFKNIEHRLEFVRKINKIKFYNDSKATNIDSACTALEAFRDKNIILIGGGYDKHVDFYDWINKIKEIKVKYLILIGETKNKIKNQCEELNFKNYLLCESFEQAIKKSFDLAISKDCVLLSPACASWDMFDNYEQRGNIFKDLVNKF